MFETAELGKSVSKEEYREREPVLREQLLQAQVSLRKATFPVIVLFAGVDAAGKGETANLLNEWMDPRGVLTHAYESPSEEESERPSFWRFWRDLPPRGRVGIFLSAWYSKPLLDRAYGKSDSESFDRRLDEIVSFERTLAEDGALILKFWMHLGRKEQRKRFEAFEKEPDQRWRVTRKDWDHWKRYDKFVAAAEQLILRTSTGFARWRIVEGVDPRFRSLKVGSILLERIRRRLDEETTLAAAQATRHSDNEGHEQDTSEFAHPTTILSELDLTKRLDKKVYRKRLSELQGRLNLLQREAKKRRVSTILVFEGWDAAGKGGAIRRITGSLDARTCRVIPIGAPTDEERSRHYMWRFWRYLPRAGRVTVFDRSWYGRVLVERIEGLATEREWRRAYAEINDFEQLLIDHGVVLLKFWIHISKDRQHERFELRRQTPHKRWKITDEDWRNREQWDAYAVAVNAMVESTSTKKAPWILVEGNDKRFARVKILQSVCDKLNEALAVDSKKRS